MSPKPAKNPGESSGSRIVPIVSGAEKSTPSTVARISYVAIGVISQSPTCNVVSGHRRNTGELSTRATWSVGPQGSGAHPNGTLYGSCIHPSNNVEIMIKNEERNLSNTMNYTSLRAQNII